MEMRQIDINKYFTMSNMANMYIPMDLGETKIRFVGGNKEGEYRGVKYKINITEEEVVIEINFEKKHVKGSISVFFFPMDNRFKIMLKVNVPLLGFVDYNNDVYYIAKGFIGTVYEDVTIYGDIDRDKLIITNARGEPVIIIGGLKIAHMNFNIHSDDYEMCLGTIQTKFPIDALPAMIALIMKTVAMPTSHAWRSNICSEYGSDVLVNDCILYDDERGNQIINKFFIKSNKPPKKVVLKTNLEKEFEEYVRQCFDEIYYNRCEETDDDYDDDYEDDYDDW